MIETIIVMLAALALDRVLGEPRHWHPLVGFGHLAAWLEAKLRRDRHGPMRQFACGVLAWCAAAAIPSVLLALLLSATAGGWSRLVLDALLLYLCLGYRSLTEHARAVARPLDAGDLPEARRQVARIVSRDPEALDASGVTRATVESVLENGNDAILASLFWYLVAGAPGAVLHRLANTLDASWGYRTPRYLYFGRAAARIDDALAFVPARWCALGYALAGRTRSAIDCWRRQARRAASPNAGVVIAAGAGALGIRLGGPAVYHGAIVARPEFGAGRDAKPGDIARAVALLREMVTSWLALLLVAAIVAECAGQ